MVNCARKETGIDRQSALGTDGLAINRAVIPIHAFAGVDARATRGREGERGNSMGTISRRLARTLTMTTE
jgi:hypothetical protein